MKIRALLTSLRAVASVSASRLVASAIEAGEFLLRKIFQNTASVADDHAASVGKSPSDLASLTDAQIAEVVKQAAESLGVSEAEAKAVSKRLADAGGVSEALSSQIFKEVSDLVAITDEVIRDRPQEDGIGFQDQLVGAFFKNISENIFATDDVNGALAGDDQTAQVFKVINNVAALLDTDSKSVAKALSDAFSVVESISNQLGKVSSDGATVDDASSLSIQPLFSEAPSIAEAQSFDLSTLRADQAGVSEVASLRPILTKAEFGTIADAAVLSLNKVSSDSASALDSIDRFEATKPISDGISISEVVATILIKLFDLADNGYVLDNAVKLPTKVSSDSGSVTDAGSLRGQGYAAFDYFAEDYVGYSATF